MLFDGNASTTPIKCCVNERTRASRRDSHSARRQRQEFGKVLVSTWNSGFIVAFLTLGVRRPKVKAAESQQGCPDMWDQPGRGDQTLWARGVPCRTPVSSCTIPCLDTLVLLCEMTPSRCYVTRRARNGTEIETGGGRNCISSNVLNYLEMYRIAK